MSALIKNPFNHDLPAADTPLVNVQLDGQWVKVPKGLNVIEVAKRFGKFIPHYCYHPKLSIAGNCRMCLFEMGVPKLDAQRKPVLDEKGMPVISWLPRPQIACATQATEGMAIKTSSALTTDCQEGVTEFLLINHPLDCPICDQAGECRLQEYSYDFGKGRSRFVEQKVKKPKRVELGPRIMLDDERCILCSRCIRFAREIAKQDVIGFVNRGSYSTLTVYPDRPFDSNYSLNTVDICPVGALTSKDFRFQMRVWFLRETKSICTSCATGCNVIIGSRENVVYRLTPRVNEEVNSHWMCDQGRLNFHYIHSKKRVVEPASHLNGSLFPLEWNEAVRTVAQRLKEFSPRQIAFLVSARLSCEELYLVKKLIELLGKGEEIFSEVVPRKGVADSLLRSEDLNPNTLGTVCLGIGKRGEKLAELQEKIRTKEIKCLFAIHENPEECGIPEDLLSSLSFYVWQGLIPGSAIHTAHILLAGASFAEKSGTMINVAGRLQKLHKAILCPGRAREDWRILRDLLLVAGYKDKFFEEIAQVYTEMSKEIEAFGGISWIDIGDQGIDLSQKFKV
ncbi:molybdopterin-dependent oxidoreductase [Methylacidiphilum caldifontis]|uniref:NADH dehydrogenase n=1 Tax=Methylacidiphilum caldifontis TaxID=2795386 RepID=A0A4Y8PB53_9BACT|nr:molybdopterin-dependent oxidoreductase [Methylacidiphilum caldifontis]QSR88189.1 molybdopterin-dependent oxidoreductase [Methylacidiphilum caldifontis]TFE68227.1 NADH dehydrogenase [Methylacidiphilum caldifontis]